MHVFYVQFSNYDICTHYYAVRCYFTAQIVGYLPPPPGHLPPPDIYPPDVTPPTPGHLPPPQGIRFSPRHMQTHER
jgi:hypothetical protein